jgi:hypothetical protein
MTLQRWFRITNSSREEVELLPGGAVIYVRRPRGRRTLVEEYACLYQGHAAEEFICRIKEESGWRKVAHSRKGRRYSRPV